MADKLVEIESQNWPALRDLYAPNSPKTFIGHSAVDNFIRWTDQQPDIPNLVFYSLNGDWSDGTFAVIYYDFVFTYTVAATTDRLEKLLQLIDFTNGLKIHTVMSKDYAAILNVIKSKKLQLKYDLNNLLQHLPATDALKFDLTAPEGITLKPVEQSDVHIADEVWPHRAEGTLQYLHQLAKFNPSVGAYDSDGRMIAWVFRVYYFRYSDSLPTGPLGALQVDREFYGRGLGTVVSKALARKIAESGQDVGACVFEENIHSLAIFNKMGFSVVDKVYWIETLPIQ